MISARDGYRWRHAVLLEEICGLIALPPARVCIGDHPEAMEGRPSFILQVACRFFISAASQHEKAIKRLTFCELNADKNDVKLQFNSRNVRFV